MKKYGVLCTSVLLGIMLLGGCSDSDSDSNTHIVSCNIAGAKSLGCVAQRNYGSARGFHFHLAGNPVYG